MTYIVAQCSNAHQTDRQTDRLTDVPGLVYPTWPSGSAARCDHCTGTWIPFAAKSECEKGKMTGRGGRGGIQLVSSISSLAESLGCSRGTSPWKTCGSCRKTKDSYWQWMSCTYTGSMYHVNHTLCSMPLLAMEDSYFLGSCSVSTVVLHLRESISF